MACHGHDSTSEGDEEGGLDSGGNCGQEGKRYFNRRLIHQTLNPGFPVSRGVLHLGCWLEGNQEEEKK